MNAKNHSTVLLRKALPPLLFLAASVALLGGCASTESAMASLTKCTGSKLNPEQQQQQRQKEVALRDSTLAELYRNKPQAKEEIAKSVGYAVFDISGRYLLLAVEANGKGVLTDRTTNQVVYMEALKLGTGLSLGYEDYRLIMIFNNKAFMEQFKKDGADVSGDARLVAKGVGGMSVNVGTADSFNPEVKIYQITDKGLAVKAFWGATGFKPDCDLT